MSSKFCEIMATVTLCVAVVAGTISALQEKLGANTCSNSAVDALHAAPHLVDNPAADQKKSSAAKTTVPKKMKVPETVYDEGMDEATLRAIQLGAKQFEEAAMKKSVKVKPKHSCIATILQRDRLGVTERLRGVISGQSRTGGRVRKARSWFRRCRKRGALLDTNRHR
jgi:hypothetical protein